MKKKMKILMLTLMLILTSALTLTVNAADATVTLNSNKSQVNAGDEFEVTMNVSCEEGINGLQGNVSYDETNLELVSIAVTDTTKWFNLGENTNLAIIHNSSDTETSADIVKVTLKVKDTAEVGTAKVTISDIVVDSDAASNSMKQVGTKEIQVSIMEESANPGQTQGGDEEDNPGEIPEGKTLTEIEITKAPTKNTYKVGDKFDKTGMQVVAKYSDGTSKEITNYIVANGDKLTEGQTGVKISYTEGNVTKTVEQKITVVKNVNISSDNKSDFQEITEDKTKTEDTMPKTGVNNIVAMMIVIVAVFGVVGLVKYSKYREI